MPDSVEVPANLVPLVNRLLEQWEAGKLRTRLPKKVEGEEDKIRIRPCTGCLHHLPSLADTPQRCLIVSISCINSSTRPSFLAKTLVPPSQRKDLIPPWLERG